MTKKNFLPKDYEMPKQSSGYMALEKGINKILVLGSAIYGWEYWNKDKKPVRLKEEPKELPEDIRINDDGKPSKVKHFWAFPVWNFEEKRVQILELTQSSIQSAINNIAQDPDWGDPIMTYPITITREGESLDTKYTIMPSPKKDVSDEIKEAWAEVEANGFDLDRLFDGGNPFSAE